MEQKQYVDTIIKVETALPKTNKDKQSQHRIEQAEDDELDYSKQAQWLRTMVLETNDGLISTASLMIGVGVINKHHVKDVIILCGLAGILVGAFITAVGEFFSVISPRMEIQKGLVHPLHVAISLVLESNLPLLVFLLSIAF
ncbi:hypothetical protein SOVF_177250 [Spinacia oleracea]|nr:hypothetical protein SOVF_177250 [Spinacia oleracea]